MAGLLERGARAMALANNDYEGDELQWSPYVDDARAVIAEMREPTEAMQKWAELRWSSPGTVTFADMWQAMIDAALAEEG